RAHEASLAAELPGEKRQRGQPGDTPAIRLAIVGEPEQVLDHELEALGRADVDQDVRLVLAHVPPVVHDARRDLDDLARPGDVVAAIAVEAHAARHELEALRDVGVHVPAGDCSARPDVEIAHQALAAGVLAALTDDEAVALDAVLVALA